MYLRRLRQYIGVALYDLPMVMLPAMRPSNLESGSLPCTRMHNQGEHLSFSKKVKGVRCNWQGGSDKLLEHYPMSYIKLIDILKIFYPFEYWYVCQFVVYGKSRCLQTPLALLSLMP